MKIKGSYLWAGALVVALAAWLGSDDLIDQARGLSDADAKVDAGADAAVNTGQAAAQAESKAKPLPMVRVKVLKAEQRFSELVVTGRTEAARRVEVRGETAGRVIATPAKKGRPVRAGDVLCQLDMADRDANYAQAKAALEWASLDYNVARNLGKKGYGAKNREMSQRANYDAAKAALARAELEIARTRIIAPFDGVVETRTAEVGAYISVGGSCVTIVELSPLLVVGYVGEREVGQLKIGMDAGASLVTGQEVKGKIRFISSSAEPSTRTFRIEIEISNTDLSVKDGVTAQISVPLQPVVAHRFSPAVLTLTDDGKVGVRIVNDEDLVVFVPVTILASDKNGVWVTGLPPSPAVITVGHEYVRAGQKVRRAPNEPNRKTAEITQ
ncbi:Probable RND efflux membrane fusion protein [hydrothermal vent metagenome]|uniref:Probable RND efflux membrane fusion protein n=1 Tax=hydrothermal vent metagenome TaxID=652676 RepID=A0A3B0TH12_9ZZZZ